MNSWFNNVLIYFDNLSEYYAISVLLSFLAVFLTWWLKDYVPKDNVVQQNFSSNFSDSNVSSSENKCEACESHSVSDNLLSQAKQTRQNVATAKLQNLKSSLTMDQLQEERDTERKQLQAIFELLQQQEEKFHVGSMAELEDQLRLYRR